MKSIVVLSYYQLLHAIALSLELGEKTDLYFVVNHLGEDENLISRIKESGVFNRVIPIDHKRVNDRVREELSHTAGMSSEEIDEIGNSIFEKYLTPFYSDVFSNADIEDDIYLYNDFQPHYYYIAGRFSRITGIEDGYGNLEDNITMVNKAGIEAFNNGMYKSPFVGKYWPQMQWKNEAVKTVIVSRPLSDNAPEYLKAKAKVIDYYDLVERHREEHEKAVRAIFGNQLPDIRDDSSLVLTQPLDRNRYCSPLDNYLLHRKLVSDELKKSKTVYIKPHPADRTDYSILESDSVILLDRRFPAEMLGKSSFSRVISYMSAITEKFNAAEHIMILEGDRSDRQHIIDTIKQQIADEKIKLDYYVRVRDLTPEAYVNVYLLLEKAPNIETRVNVLIDENAGPGPDYFDISHARDRINGYFERADVKGSPHLWAEKVRKLTDIGKEKLNMISFMEDADCSDNGISRLICDSDADFAVVYDPSNPAVDFARDIRGMLSNRPIQSLRILLGHTEVDGVRRSIGYRGTEGCIVRSLSNRLFSTSLIRRIAERYEDPFNEFGLLDMNCAEDGVKGEIGINPSRSYFVDLSDYNAWNEDVERLIDRLADTRSIDSLACLILEIFYCSRMSNMHYNDIESRILEKASKNEVILNGFARALGSLMDTEEKEKKRFIFVNEDIYRYGRKEINRLARSGYFEKSKTADAGKKKIWRMIRRKS